MNIKVTARHMEITDSIRDYAHDKVTEGLSDFTRVESIHVVLNIEKYRHIAEVIVQAKNHIHVEAREESDDMYVSIDRAVEKAQKQLRKLRDKIQDHKSRDKLALVDMEMSAESEQIPDEETQA